MILSRKDDSALTYGRVPLGLCLSVGSLLAWKAKILGVAAGTSSWWTSLGFVGIVDGLVCGVGVALATVALSLSRGWARFVVIVAMILSVGLLSIDAAAINLLGCRFTIPQALPLIGEWRLLPWVLSGAQITWVAIAIASAAVSIRASRIGVLIFIGLVGLCVVGTATVRVVLPMDPPEVYQRYALTKLLSLSSLVHVRDTSRYEELESALAYRALSAPTTLQVPRLGAAQTPSEKLNVVVLVVESLSLVDFQAYGGLYSAFPKLENLGKNEGRVFTNFFTNYYNTNGALFSLLGGVPPIPAPTQDEKALESYPVWDSVPRRFQALGYHTEFLSTTPLTFMRLGDIVRRLSFRECNGGSDVPAFANASKGVYGWPSDEALMEEGASRVEALLRESEPFFLTILTSSGHPPFVDPSGRDNSERGVFAYVDEQLERFFLRLKAVDFFQRGILLVLGDHRKWTPLGDEERITFGSLGWYRVPLFVFGRGVDPGTEDRRLNSTTDLLSRLPALFDPSKPLAPHVLIVDKEFQDNPTPGIDGKVRVVFQDTGGVRDAIVTLRGRSLSWEGRDLPPNKHSIEASIHQLRAAVQHAKIVNGDGM